MSLLVAQALNAKGLRARDLFRVTFFIPMVLSPIVIALIYSLVFDTNYGLLNATLKALLGCRTPTGSATRRSRRSPSGSSCSGARSGT